MKNTISILVLLLSFCCQGQTIQGLVLEHRTHGALAYVNIGINNKGIGTVSDLNGKFNLKLSEDNFNDTIFFSIIGYKSKQIKVSEVHINDTIVVLLKSQPYILNEVEIISYRKHKTIGKRNHLDRFIVSFTESYLGAEMGTLIKINKRIAKIENVNISVQNCTNDSIEFRLNIYSYKNKIPNKTLIDSPIYFTLSKNDSGKVVTVDISKFNIIVKDDIVITVECLNDIGKDNVSFYATLMRGRFFARNASQDKWICFPNKTFPFAFGISMNAMISY